MRQWDLKTQKENLVTKQNDKGIWLPQPPTVPPMIIYIRTTDCFLTKAENKPDDPYTGIELISGKEK